MRLMKEKLFLLSHLSNVDSKKLDEMIESFGLDKCIEIYKNLAKVIDLDEIEFQIFLDFAYYDIALSEILFTLLRHQENHVKAFLANQFNDYPVQIEARPSNYAKTKYYFKIPVGVNKFLDIRTHNYTHGPVDYYDAIKTLDFGDVNLIMFHLPESMIARFSNNPNILDDLDKTRQLRNYVYHHNMLYSLGKEELESSIQRVLINLPNQELKLFYLKKINSLSLKGDEKNKELYSKIKVNITL